ncbi:tubulin---tyrosine ligase [Strigomonas culicis]|nr:tubulin---tyrosine ligase [Strigomonas culicis]|eukprot:EPY26992.1 tubulin---tyrosine ligase [Strigomonas culicis]
MPMERLIEQRRIACLRHRALTMRQGDCTPPSSRLYPTRAMRVRMPMGTSGDGEARMIDFIDGTRCVTLKSTMVSTLLRHHRHNWETLGAYLPMSFLLAPGQPQKDERDALLETCSRRVGWTGGQPPLWIAKSSSGSHGDNIQIFNGDRAGLQRLLHFVDSQRSRMWVAQQYIDRPLLYHRRKFDIRCFALLFRDPYEIYVHEELIMRTSSVVYDRETATAQGSSGRLAHITNHCVQSEGADYSLYEEGNELWREHLDGLVRYKGERLLQRHQSITSPKRTIIASRPAPGSALGSPSVHEASYQSSNGAAVRSPDPATRDHHGGSQPTLANTIMPQIYHVVRDTLLAAREHLPEEPHPPPTICFQVFGYDFLIDENLKVWLLEINGAPAGAARLLPRLMGDTIEKAIAPHFPATVLGASRPKNGYAKVYPQTDAKK